LCGAACPAAAYYSAALNSFIHVVMYAYYLLSALGVKQVSFIKHYITTMQVRRSAPPLAAVYPPVPDAVPCACAQMTQFLTMLMQSAYDLYTGGGGYPVLTTRILGVYMLTLLALFANFLIQDRQRIRAEKRKAGEAGKTGKAANGERTPSKKTQ
jgi:hypothetical protein